MTYELIHDKFDQERMDRLKLDVKSTTISICPVDGLACGCSKWTMCQVPPEIKRSAGSNPVNRNGKERATDRL